MNAAVHLLRGREVTDAGAVRLADLGDLAVACTPGCAPTVGPLRDANEDAAVVARVADGTWLAVVVDGNGTAAGVEAVLDHVAVRVGALLSEVEPDVRGLVEGAMDALHGVRRAGSHATGASVTAVVGRGPRTWTWTRGDTAAVLVGGGVPRPLGGVVPRPATPVPLPPQVAGRRGPGDRVVLATDGLFEALGTDWADVVVQATGGPAAVAQAIVHAALGRGAHDAVTVAVVGAQHRPFVP